MSELEQFIRTNAAAFDTQEPAPGHEERFLARLDTVRTGTAPSAPERFSALSGFFRTRDHRALAYALALFAAVLLVIRPGDPFRGAGNDPEAIYMAYMGQVAELYGHVPADDSAAWDASLQAMTEEEAPLFVQLPDELSRREQARILKDYYGELLAGAKKFKNIR